MNTKFFNHRSFFVLTCLLQQRGKVMTAEEVVMAAYQAFGEGDLEALAK